jgi:fibronectin type 3 domain-containing protein
MVMGCSVVMGQDIIHFVKQDSIYLTWKPVKGANKYVVKTEGKWLVQTKRIIDNQDIKNTIGGQAELYLKAAGLSSADSDFSDEDFTSLSENDEDYNFFLAICATDKNMLKALGSFVQLKMPENSNSVTVIAYKDTIELESFKTNIDKNLSTIEIPIGLNSESIGSRVQVTWNPATDFSIIRTNVYRARSLLGPYKLANTGIGLFSSENGFVDKDLSNGTYFYYLKHQNVFGFESKRSEIIEVEIDTKAPTRIDGLLAFETEARKVKLKWEKLNGQSYQVFKSFGDKFVLVYPPSKRISFTDSFYYDSDVKEGMEYRYFISLASNSSKFITSDTLAITLKDATPPSQPRNVSGTVSKDGIVTLKWDKNTEKDILGYEIERFTGDSGTNNYLLTPEPISTNKFNDNLGEKSQSIYRYQIFAIDKNYNRSKGSMPIKLQRPDDIPPLPPQFVSVNRNQNLIYLEWTICLDNDFEKFNVYRKSTGSEWNLIVSTTNNIIIDTLTNDGDYTYTITSIDINQNESSFSREHRFTYRDEYGLEAPTNLEVKDSNGHLFLSWNNASDKRIRGYYLERKLKGESTFQPIAEHTNGEDFFWDVYTTYEKETIYRITSYDSDWYQSKPLIITFYPD